MSKILTFSKRGVVGLVLSLGVGLFLLAACGENTPGTTALPTVTQASGAAIPTVTAEPSATVAPTVKPNLAPTATTGPLATATFVGAGSTQPGFTAALSSGGTSTPLPAPTEPMVAPLKTPSGSITREPPAAGGAVVVVGTVNSFDAASGLLQLGLADGKVVSVKVSASTTITGSGRSASAADIKSGMLVTASGSYNGQGQLEAVSLALGLPAPPTVSNPIRITTPVPNK
jgi:hypothetical protein